MKGSHIKEKATEDILLHQQFNALQKDWDSYKQSNPRNLRRYSTDSKAMAKALQLLDCSPRNLMSSLQQRLSPSEGGWKIRTNDLAKEEIRRERTEVIGSGRLKGRRRLFEAPEGETEMGFGGREKICNGWKGLVQKSEVRSSVSFYNSVEDHESESRGSKDLPLCFQFSSSSSSLSSLTGEKVGEVLEVEKKVVASVEARRVAYNYGGSSNRRSWMVLMAWLAIASIFVYAILIVLMRIFGVYGDEREMLLVPT